MTNQSAIDKLSKRNSMALFEQEILINNMGTYTMNNMWCKKVNTRYGFKAYGEDLKTTETLTSADIGAWHH
jgi:hypothetical protein